jgi:hypothetical protein
MNPEADTTGLERLVQDSLIELRPLRIMSTQIVLEDHGELTTKELIINLNKILLFAATFKLATTFLIISAPCNPRRLFLTTYAESSIVLIRGSEVYVPQDWQ